MSNKAEADFDFIATQFDKAPAGPSKLQTVDMFCNYLKSISNTGNLKKGIDMIIKLRNAIPQQYRSFTDPGIIDALTKLGKSKGREIEDYISTKLK